MIGKYTGALRRAERTTKKPEDILAILAQVGLARGKHDNDFNDAWVAHVDQEASRTRRAAVKERMMNLLREKASDEKIGEETIVDCIVNEGGKNFHFEDRINMIDNIDPKAGHAKELINRIIEVEEGGYMLVCTLRRATEAPEQNRIEVDDLGWFIPAMIGIAEAIEIESWAGENTDYDRIVNLLSEEARDEAVNLLRDGQYGNYYRWLEHPRAKPEARANKLVLVLTGDLERSLEALPEKVVSWKAVRNIANSLTNQLPIKGGVDIKQAHMSNFRQGPVREFTTEEGQEGYWRPAFDGQGWYAFAEDHVSRLYWKSLSSGCALEAVKRKEGEWSIRFIPSPEDPGYRGAYYGLYEGAEKVRNINL